MFLQVGDVGFSSWDISFFVTSGFSQSISEKFEKKHACKVSLLCKEKSKKEFFGCYLCNLTMGQ